MKKKLINSDKELVEYFLSEVDDDYDIVESILNIEFPFEDGKYQSDIWNDDSIDESQEVNTTTWRKKTKDHGFPEDYPCVVVSSFEKDYDRFGLFSIQIVEYVYLSDFNIIN